LTLILEEVASFWAFVTERDRVRVRRAAGETPPWTEDPIIVANHFTNVHRWQDPGTRWIMAYVEDMDLVEQPDELLFALVAYRTLNRVATFERFGFPPRDPRFAWEWTAELHRARLLGWKVGSRRHQTSLARTGMALQWLAERDYADAVWPASDGVEAVGRLTRVNGLGPFYSIQVVADLLTVGGRRLGLAMGDDPMTSLAVGSRSALRILTGGIDPTTFVPNDQSGWRRSLARLWGLDDDERDALHELHQAQPKLSCPLTYVDIEHSLCEWNRYHKLTIGDPRIGRRVKRDGA